MGCVYLVTNLINGKQYVGKTAHSLEARRKCHFEERNDNTPFHNALKKYGFENFEWLTLFNGCDENFLFEEEMEFIKEHNTKVPNGYNLTDGGEGSCGYKHSKETRRKMSEARKGKKFTEETRRKMSVSRKCRPAPSKETRGKLSEALKGNKNCKGVFPSEETRKKISETKKGKKGKKFTEETRRKLSIKVKEY